MYHEVTDDCSVNLLLELHHPFAVGATGTTERPAVNSALEPRLSLDPLSPEQTTVPPPPFPCGVSRLQLIATVTGAHSGGHFKHFAGTAKEVVGAFATRELKICRAEGTGARTRDPPTKSRLHYPLAMAPLQKYTELLTTSYSKFVSLTHPVPQSRRPVAPSTVPLLALFTSDGRCRRFASSARLPLIAAQVPRSFPAPRVALREGEGDDQNVLERITQGINSPKKGARYRDMRGSLGFVNSRALLGLRVKHLTHRTSHTRAGEQDKRCKWRQETAISFVEFSFVILQATRQSRTCCTRRVLVIGTLNRRNQRPGGHGAVVVTLLTSHQGESGSIPGGVALGFSHDDAAGRHLSRLELGPVPYTPPCTNDCLYALRTWYGLFRWQEGECTACMKKRWSARSNVLSTLLSMRQPLHNLKTSHVTMPELEPDLATFSGGNIQKLMVWSGRRNTGVEETRYPPEGPLGSGIARHDTHVRKRCHRKSIGCSRGTEARSQLYRKLQPRTRLKRCHRTANQRLVTSSPAGSPPRSRSDTRPVPSMSRSQRMVTVSEEV
ncbi:hypothetical protein PR048_025142 [Dryococelus australis]|uniref:Uncharacterized protein n=1 Tax=Dryococelus australis TaxID=614101 RepID=A0ABQ9GQM6_9NEOP|nr:hypothetical protein PR048_025142 [Dryococelus australis]